MKELNPTLYSKFQELTKNYPDSRYYRKIQNIRNKHHYILYRLSDKGKIKLFVKLMNMEQNVGMLMEFFIELINLL
jgi:hypothetical protein